LFDPSRGGRCCAMTQSTEIEVQNLDHLGLVAGIIDEIGGDRGEIFT